MTAIANGLLEGSKAQEIKIEKDPPDGFWSAWNEASSGGKSVIAAVVGALHKANQTNLAKPNEKKRLGFLEQMDNERDNIIEIVGSLENDLKDPRLPNEKITDNILTSEVAYDHYVMLDDVKYGNERYTVTIWSYGFKKEYSFHQDHIASYFHKLISIDPS